MNGAVPCSVLSASSKLLNYCNDSVLICMIFLFNVHFSLPWFTNEECAAMRVSAHTLHIYLQSLILVSVENEICIM